MSDLKFKLLKSQQEVTTLEHNVSISWTTRGCLLVCGALFYRNGSCCVTQVTRLEGQVTRYKMGAENAEKVEEDLKVEKRKLHREVICRFHLCP